MELYLGSRRIRWETLV